jgi:CheY-like chemotaxis protein
MAPSESSWNILLVDDEEGIRSVVRRSLEGDGHYVETADDGVQALKKFKAAKWNLVITDLMMPKLGGDGLAKVIKQIDPTIPVILLTGSVDYAADVRGERSPFDMVIPKPFRYDTIRAAIASIQLGKGV